MNKLLIEHLKHFEGCRLRAYKDPAGVWTCGYGCTGKDIRDGTKWTQEYADNELERRANDAMTEALRLSPILKDESESRRAAIADFIYNCGEGAYRKSSLKHYVDLGQWQHASMEMLKWVHGGGHILPGLVKRRAVTSDWLLENV